MSTVQRCYRVQSKDTSPYVYDIHKAANPIDVANYENRGPVMVAGLPITNGNPVTFAVDGFIDETSNKKVYVKSLYDSFVPWTSKKFVQTGIFLYGGSETITAGHSMKIDYDTGATTTFRDPAVGIMYRGSASRRDETASVGSSAYSGSFHRVRAYNYGTVEYTDWAPTLPSGRRTGASMNISSDTEYALSGVEWYNYSDPSANYFFNEIFKIRWDERNVVGSFNTGQTLSNNKKNHGTYVPSIDSFVIIGAATGINDRVIEYGKMDGGAVATFPNGLQRSMGDLSVLTNDTDIAGVGTWRSTKFKVDSLASALTSTIGEELSRQQTGGRASGHVCGFEESSYYLALGWVTGDNYSDVVRKMRFSDDVNCQLLSGRYAAQYQQSVSGGGIA